MLRIKLFGAQQLSLDGQPITQSVTGRRLALLAYLLGSKQPCSRNTLADLLWADITEDRARENLRGLLSGLRRIVGNYLLIDRQAVNLNRQAPYWADVDTFDSCLTMSYQTTANLPLLREVLQLYQGEFLEGYFVQGAPIFENWLTMQRQQWHKQAVAGWEQLAHHYLAQGEDADGLVATEHLLALEPWHEEAHRQKMFMLARSGRREAALAQFERCCAILREEVDAPPGDETVLLYQQIKAGQLQPTRPGPNLTLITGHTAVGPARGDGQRLPTVKANDMSSAGVVARPTPVVLTVDWGAIPYEPRFYGRQPELDQLQRWCVLEQRRVVVILGAGGQGKTALAVRFIRTLSEPGEGKADCLSAGQPGKLAAQPPFERIIGRSLLTAPPLRDILQDWLQQLSQHQVVTLPQTLDQQFTLLHEYLQQRRFLFILDNVESIFLDDGSGACRPGYEAYEQLWQLFVQRTHQACLLLTSRERPRALSSHEEQLGALRTLLLDGLAPVDGEELLRAHRVMGPASAISALLRLYSGNPLALKLVADTIDEFFGGNVESFLQEETPFFADIAAVLDQQFARLSPLEVELLTWLALEQEPIASATLWANLVVPPAKRDFLTALRTLVRRSLVQREGEYFSLQNVILEYTRSRLVNEIGDELSSNRMMPPGYSLLADEEPTQLSPQAAELIARPHPLLVSPFNRYALLKAQAKAYVRAGQERLVLEPLAQRWQLDWGKLGLAELFHRLLYILRTVPPYYALAANGYAASNILHLLLQLKFDFQGYDFSHLVLRQAYLRDATLQGINFAGATLRDCLFTDVFAAATALAFHPSGEWVAIGTFDGTIRLVRLVDHQVLHQLAGHAVTIFGLAISPDGKLLASSSSDQQVHVWDLESYTLRHCYQETANFVRTVSFSPDNRWLAVAGGDGTVRLYAATSGHLCYTLHSPHAWVCAVAFSPDGQWLAAGGRDGGISLWVQHMITAPTTPTPTYSLRGHERAIETLIFSHDSQLLFSGSRDQLIHVWQLPTPEDDHTPERLQTPWRTLRGHRQSLRRLDISPDGRYLASGGADALVHLWDVRTGTLVDTLVGHERWVWAVAFHPHMTENHCLLVSAANDQRILFWEINVQAGVVHSQLQQGISGYSDGVRSLVFLPQSPLLVSGGFDRAVRIWDVESNLPHTVLSGHRDWIFCVAASPDGRWLASAGYERLIYLWPRTPPTEVLDRHGKAHLVEAAPTAQPEGAPIRLSGHTSIISGLTFSPDGQTLASCCQESKICLWNIQEQRLVQTLQWQNALAWSVAFSPDGQLLASAHFDRTIQLWDMQSFAEHASSPQAQHLRTLAGHTGLVWMVAFSPDGQTVISTSNDHTVRLWERSGEPRRILTGHTNIVRSLAVGPRLADGHFTFATGDDDKVIHIWDGQSGELLQRLHGHRGVIHTLAYSPDGAILASASEDGGIRLWDVKSGAHLQTLRAPRPYSGMNITGLTGITPAQKAALLALGAVEQ